MTLFWCLGLLTGEEMMVVLSQFERTLIQLPGALPRLGTEPGPHVLDTLLAVWIQEHHDGVPLSVVQTIHRIGGDVQHGMLVLAAQTESWNTSRVFARERSRWKAGWQLTELSESILTRSMICLMVWRRMIPELRWSVPASLGSLSERRGRRQVYTDLPSEYWRKKLRKISFTQNLLASSKRSGSSLDSFSLATSAIGPKMTTGLKKPAFYAGETTG